MYSGVTRRVSKFLYFLFTFVSFKRVVFRNNRTCADRYFLTRFFLSVRVIFVVNQKNVYPFKKKFQTYLTFRAKRGHFYFFQKKKVEWVENCKLFRVEWVENSTFTTPNSQRLFPFVGRVLIWFSPVIRRNVFSRLPFLQKIHENYEHPNIKIGDPFTNRSKNYHTGR